MSIGSWDPTGECTDKLSISPSQLQRFIELSRSDLLEALPSQLSAEERDLAHIMRWEPEVWREQLVTVGNDDLVHLIRFFTRAEMLLPGWEAAELSPAITISKLLRERGAKLDREMLAWIRANSSNRFIPNGKLI